ncbi:MAG: hypothetical protein A3K18_26365 [Lentisphaerae bacterium RIFOXYA12_64_32]|nr:MAG: hypothetical protein A3K18_26365 [Lentisphaerae bacterium RIFOXYA12_64_32]
MLDSRQKENRDFARGLRHRSSDAEYLLWYHLRGKKRLGWKFRRQQPIGPFIADFVCLRRRLVIELDGGQHSSPAHSDYDARRTRWLERNGFRVLRFWNLEIYDDLARVVSRIDEALAEAEALPPQSLPTGSGR